MRKERSCDSRLALRRIDSPMGISEYELSKSLPKRFESILPTTDEIEAELSEFAKEIGSISAEAVDEE